MDVTRWFPTYGNWGGPGWSGGEYPATPADTDWSVPAVDSLDDLFRHHDWSYQLAIECARKGSITDREKSEHWASADRSLLRAMEDLPKDPRRWKSPANKLWWAKFYRLVSIAAFWTRLRLWWHVAASRT